MAATTLLNPSPAREFSSKPPQASSRVFIIEWVLRLVQAISEAYTNYISRNADQSPKQGISQKDVEVLKAPTKKSMVKAEFYRINEIPISYEDSGSRFDIYVNAENILGAPTFGSPARHPYLGSKKT